MFELLSYKQANLPVAIAVVQAGQQLAPGKVARGPEHREVERVDRNELCRQIGSL